MVDLSNSAAVIKELFDDDRWVKEEFAKSVSEELSEMAEALAECFAAIPALNDAANNANSVRSALVAAFAFGVLDDILVSTKLLLTGKLLAAGNGMRQAVEGIAMAVLCSTDDLLIIDKKKNQPVVARYWEKLEAGDRRVQGHRALDQLAWNARALGIDPGAVERLLQAKRHYNTFSHPGPLAIASRVSLGVVGVAYAGGHFDVEKLDAYRIEIRERIGLCGVLPSLIARLTQAITIATGATAQAIPPHK